MGYIDAHCHLGTRQFDSNRREIIQRMLKAGVDQAIMICCSRHDLEIGQQLRQQYPGFKLAVGLHPQGLEHYDADWLEHIGDIIAESHPDMIGEIGLDYDSHRHSRLLQQQYFIKQLQFAIDLDLPVDVHCRDASKDTYDILKQYPARGIIHSFSGSVEMARLFIKQGYYLSFGASVLFPNARRPKEVVREIPLERLLIETDAPYQSPIRNHVHEPADIVNIYQAVADIKGISVDELIRAAEENFNTIFSK